MKLIGNNEEVVDKKKVILAITLTGSPRSFYSASLFAADISFRWLVAWAAVGIPFRSKSVSAFLSDCKLILVLTRVLM